MTAKAYIDQVLAETKEKHAGKEEFIQAVEEFLPTLEPYLNDHTEIVEKNLLSLIVEPERLIQFRVPWQDDEGKWQVNRAYRVQYNSAIGPYKGGLRFHPTTNESIVRFLGFEQIFKNSLTGLPIGGGKGGSDFDPKGKTDAEVMRFCQSFMTEFQKHIGPDIDVPAGDIGVGGREIGFLFGQYKRLNGFSAGVLTGKPVSSWGSLARTEATGYGLVYFVQNALEDRNDSFKGKKVVVSGSGNVSIYAIQKAQELGATVLTCSDSSGYIYDPEGIDLELVKDIKEVRRGRIKEYLEQHPDATYVEGSVWSLKESYDIALPCATQNEIDAELAQKMADAGVKIVAEGANMPSSKEAIDLYQDQNILYCPGKAANAGGVAVSALEMAQNSARLAWSFERVDDELKSIMKNIYTACSETAIKYAEKDNLMAGANIAGFDRVVQTMLSQGLV
ncbi:NADP-specific glutamate dehydrogenase [Marinilactibacillus sp. Marseille-P9653]|uniref:NADP-specific glutamate dehydrogenase n=1 Tax=Marinilactibacillus sp. Marseille-P9653 TaxID=2866583 RepID=UPI001CE3B857|nr:NADP-specific glutamate dehydrogenase [Marinilactibacillus sp. Marseille-P9653]